MTILEVWVLLAGLVLVAVGCLALATVLGSETNGDD